MNEDIIKWAREAGWSEIGADLWGAANDGAMSTYALARFAALVRADEREACAKVCENIGHYDENVDDYYSETYASAIRARNQ